jgi:hypothetical protein
MKPTPRQLAFTAVGAAVICCALLCLGVSIMVFMNPALAYDGNPYEDPAPWKFLLPGCFASLVLLYVGCHVFACRKSKLHWPTAVLTIARNSMGLLRKIKPRVVLRWTLRTCLILLILGSLFTGYALLPGSIEGNYRFATCMCDSFNFIQYRDGNTVLYSCGHHSSDWIGRYEQAGDGCIHVFLRPADEAKPEILLFRAYPHRLVTRFVSADDGSSSWCIKRSLVGKAMETCLNQEITTTKIHPDRSITKTYFDRDFKQLREEHRQPKKK